MLIFGINCYHPDASAALVKDGRLIWAAEEERFSRVKHASGFPVLALRHCLKETGVNPQDIDFVAISRNPAANLFKKIAYTAFHVSSIPLALNRLKALQAAHRFSGDYAEAIHLQGKNLKTKFIHVEHHQAHAASAFFLSGFDQAAFLSLDGLGDFSSAMWGMGRGTSLQVFDRVYFPYSAGFLYTAGTQFLGFHHFGDEYKVMGLAAYGEPNFLNAFRKMVALKSGGRFELNLKYFLHAKGQAKVRWEGGAPNQDILYSPEWIKAFGLPRQPGAKVTDRDIQIASSLQAVLEEIFFHVLNHLYTKTKSENLAMAGGVAFNSVANGKITAKTPFKNIYIQPAAGDAGTAVGAAFYVYHTLCNQHRSFEMNHAFFGSAYGEKEIREALREAALSFQELPEETLIEQTVNLLAQGKIVGWFQGRMEFGPRALGNRSILADPRNPKMKDILNSRIKNREGFRPFAPAIPVEYAKEFFEMDCDESPFMLKVFPVKEDKKQLIPAVTHVDGTARVQTVSKAQHPLFWKLLRKFKDITGIPILLNTSFNESEPIVCCPEDAIQCFLKTQMDVLVIGNFLIQKQITLKEDKK